MYVYTCILINPLGKPLGYKHPQAYTQPSRTQAQRMLKSLSLQPMLSWSYLVSGDPQRFLRAEYLTRTLHVRSPQRAVHGVSGMGTANDCGGMVAS